MHQHCAPLQNLKISSTMNWMLLLATLPKQNNCTYWEILMQEREPIMKHGLHVLDTMAPWLRHCTQRYWSMLPAPAYTLLSQRRLRWLGHVHRMPNRRIPKDMLYGEQLVTRTHTAGRPHLRYRDTCKRDMKVAGIDTTTWEAATDDSGHWRSVVKAGMRRGEEKISEHEAVKREKRKQKSSHPAHPPQPTTVFTSASNSAETVMPKWG